MDVHHLTYERLGQEIETDLAVLCRECHDAVHAFSKARQMNLAAATNRFVKGMKPLQRVATQAKVDPNDYEIAKDWLRKRWQHPGSTRAHR